MSIKDILNRAADRLSRGDAWAQNALAKDNTGTQVPPHHKAACQWCSIGAIRAETQDRYQQHRAERALGNALGLQPTTLWNDNPARTQDEVVAAFRKAAAL